MTARPLPAYIGANTTETAKVRARLNEQVWTGFQPVRKAPNTGHRFIRYWRVIGQPLLGLALFIIAALTCAGWFMVVAS